MTYTASTNPLEHPINQAVRLEIEAEILRIEVEFDVRVLYACESGSRGWGFASPDSDYDVRFIYVHRPFWYLRVSPQRDVIECPISNNLDIGGWELRKALGLLKKGNATLIEWLDSPVIYRADADFLCAMRDAARQTHRAARSFHHYLHMASKNYGEHLRGEQVRLKKYLYVLRPLLAALWLEEARGVVPMRFQALVDAMVSDRDLRDAIDALVAIKRKAMESEYGQPRPILNAFIEAQLAHLRSIAPPRADDVDFSVLDRLLMDCVMKPQ